MRSRTIVFDALIVLFAVALFYNGFLDAESITPGSDMTHLFYPIKHAAQKTLRSGIIPLWNPWTFCGTPMLASQQCSPFYLPDFVILNPRNPTFTLNLYKIFHLWLLGNFLYLFLRVELRLARGAALLAAMTYPLGAFFWGHTEHVNQIASIAWFPLLLVLTRYYLRSGKSAILPALALAYGMQWLAGHPQYPVYSGFFLVCYAIFLLASSRGSSAAQITQRGCGLLASLAGGFALSLVQTLPGQELSRLSYRIFNDFEYAAGFSMKPAYLLLLLRPSFFGTYRTGLPPGDNLSEYGCYIGLVPLALAFVGLSAAVKRRKSEYLFFAVGAVVALLFALGNHTPIFRLIYVAFPTVGNFRVPPRILFLATLLLLTLAAYGLDAIGRRLAAQRTDWAVLAPALAVVVGGVIFGDLYHASKNFAFRYPVNLRKIVYEQQPWYPLTLDTDYFRTFRLMVNDAQFYDKMLPQALAGRYQRLQPNCNIVYELALVDGYEEGLLPTVRFKDFMLTYNRDFRNARPDSELMALMNIKYVYTELPVVSERFRATALPGDWEQRLPYRLYENLDWCGGVLWLHDLETRYDLQKLDGTFAREGKRMLEYGNTMQPYRKTNAPDEPIERDQGLRLWYVSPNEMHVTKSADASGMLCVSQATYPGWVAISGKTRISLKPLNAVLACFPAPAGKTTFWLRYEPLSFRIGLFLSLLTFFALMVLLIGLCV